MKLTRDIHKRTSRKVAEHYCVRINARGPRAAAQLVAILEEEGGVIELAEGRDGELVIHKPSCPFITMFEDRRSVCCVDEEMMGYVVGAAVRRTACRHDGRRAAHSHCCPTARRNRARGTLAEPGVAAAGAIAVLGRPLLPEAASRMIQMRLRGSRCIGVFSRGIHD